MSGKVHTLIMLSEVMAHMLGMKQGSPLSPTHIDLYIDEVSREIGWFKNMLGRGIHTDIIISLA